MISPEHRLRESPTNSCALSLLDDEDYGAFQRIDKLSESDCEPMVAQQLVTEKYRPEIGLAPFGVCLEVPGPSPVDAGQTEQPQNERSLGRDELQCLKTLGVFRSSATQRESEAVVFEIVNGLLDLRASGVDAFDADSDAAVMRQRSGKQPRGSVPLSILRGTSRTFAGSAWSTTIGTHQIQPTPVPVLTRQTPPADVAHPRRGPSPLDRVVHDPTHKLLAELDVSTTTTDS